MGRVSAPAAPGRTRWRRTASSAVENVTDPVLKVERDRERDLNPKPPTWQSLSLPPACDGVGVGALINTLAINASNIESFRNCTKINGDVSIIKSSFTGWDTRLKVSWSPWRSLGTHKSKGWLNICLVLPLIQVHHNLWDQVLLQNPLMVPDVEPAAASAGSHETWCLLNNSWD